MSTSPLRATPPSTAMQRDISLMRSRNSVSNTKSLIKEVSEESHESKAGDSFIQQPDRDMIFTDSDEEKRDLSPRAKALNDQTRHKRESRHNFESFGVQEPNQERFLEQEQNEDVKVTDEKQVATEAAEVPQKIENEPQPYSYMDTIGYYTGWWGTSQDQALV